MNLQTERLQLDEINSADLELIHELHSIPEVDEFNTLGIPESLEDTQKVIQPAIEDQKNKARTQFCWKVKEKESKEFIGLAGILLSNDRFKKGEIYYKLHPGYWGKGYATEIAREMIYFGFDKLKLHRIEAGVATENYRSIRVLEKSGMNREGLCRKALPIRGQWIDDFRYGIVEDDPRD